MSELIFSKIMEQVKRRELELEDRRQQLKDLVLDISEAERERVVKRGAKDFWYWAKRVFPEYCSFDFNELHKDIYKYYTGKQRIVHVVAGPPEHGKTALLRLLKIYGAIYGLKHYQIKVTETMELSLIDMMSIKMEFEDNVRLNFLYGKLKTDGKWDEGAFKVAATRWNKYGCWFEAFAFGVPPTGRLREQFRPDFADIDDLENYRKSGNIKISEDKLQFINNDILPRLSLDAPIIWFGNNARKTMAMNIIVDMEKQKREMDYPAFRVHLYKAWDIRKQRPLWYQRYKYNSEEEMRTAFGVGLMTWLGNYQQTPVIVDGKEFKKEHWREYKNLPDDAYGLMFCDPASGKSGCYKAAAILLYSKTGGKFYMPELYCRQSDWEPFFLWMYDVYGRLQKRIRYIGWEEDFHQDQYLLFRKLYKSVADRPELPIRAVPVKNEGPKDERIRALSVPYENGQIVFHEEIARSREGAEAIMHLIGFPDYTFKDFGDALATCYRLVFNMFAGSMRTGNSGHAGYQSMAKTRGGRDVH